MGGVAVFAIETSETFTGGGVVERHVVEYGEDPVLDEMRNECCSCFEIGDLQVEHVSVVATFCRNVRQLQIACVFERLQTFSIGVPACHAIVEYLLSVFEFCVEVGCVELARQVARAEFNPCVLIDFTAVELHAVCAFFADDFGVIGILLVGDENGSAFTHTVVLCLVETVATKIAECAERTSFVGGHHTLRGIFYDE